MVWLRDTKRKLDSGVDVVCDLDLGTFPVMLAEFQYSL